MADLGEFYTKSQRELQDQHDTHNLADALLSAAVAQEISERQSAFIESREFFFLSSVNGSGEPTVSYKGGAEGFVSVQAPDRLIFPSYDGNGMFLSLGNISETGKVGLLFIDFETPNRLRIQGTARLREKTDDLPSFPGVQLLVEVLVDAVFVNCARYIAKHSRTEPSPYTPVEKGEQPLPSWKRIDGFQPVLPEADRQRVSEEGGTISAEEYVTRLEEGRS